MSNQNKLTIKEVIAKVMADGNRVASVTMNVWDENNRSNSGFCIYTGSNSFGGATLRIAFDEYLNSPAREVELQELADEAAEIINASILPEHE